jgi:hypothetical protein
MKKKSVYLLLMAVIAGGALTYLPGCGGNAPTLISIKGGTK